MIYDPLWMTRKKRTPWVSLAIAAACLATAYAYGKLLEAGMVYLVLKTMWGQRCD